MPDNNKKLVWLKLDACKVAKLQQMALTRNRTLNGLILEMVNQAIQERNKSKHNDLPLIQ